MTTITTVVVRCDVCSKETACERYETPPDPWLSLHISSGWEDSFGKKVATDIHACSPSCAITALEKVVARFKRFPTSMGIGDQ